MAIHSRPIPKDILNQLIAEEKRHLPSPLDEKKFIEIFGKVRLPPPSDKIYHALEMAPTPLEIRDFRYTTGLSARMIYKGLRHLVNGGYVLEDVSEGWLKFYKLNPGRHLNPNGKNGATDGT